MDTKLSSEIQALDELGRWEPARILSESDGGEVLVRFIGWGREFDTVLPKSKVRVAMNPFVNGVDFVSGKKRSASNIERKYLSLLRSLEADKEVKVICDSGIIQECTVVELDRFRRSVVVKAVETQQQFTVHASAIVRENVVTEEAKHCSKKRKKAIRVPHSPSGGETVLRTNDEIPYETQSQEIINQQDPTYFQVSGPSGKKVSCGDLVNVQVGTDQTVGIGICKITKQVDDAIYVEGFIPGSDGVTLKTPVEHVRDSKFSGTASKTDMQYLVKVQEEQFRLSMKTSTKCPQYRRECRKQQIGCFFRSEVKKALLRKAATTHVNFGLCFWETDLELFNLNPFCKRRVTYSYKAGNLNYLDDLLGKRWDILVIDGHVSFVTEVKVSLSKDWMLKASIGTAVSWGLLPASYREKLQNVVLNADF